MVMGNTLIYQFWWTFLIPASVEYEQCPVCQEIEYCEPVICAWDYPNGTQVPRYSEGCELHCPGGPIRCTKSENSSHMFWSPTPFCVASSDLTLSTEAIDSQTYGTETSLGPTEPPWENTTLAASTRLSVLFSKPVYIWIFAGGTALVFIFVFGMACACLYCARRNRYNVRMVTHDSSFYHKRGTPTVLHNSLVSGSPTEKVMSFEEPSDLAMRNEVKVNQGHRVWAKTHRLNLTAQPKGQESGNRPKKKAKINNGGGQIKKNDWFGFVDPPRPRSIITIRQNQPTDEDAGGQKVSLLAPLGLNGHHGDLVQPDLKVSHSEQFGDAVLPDVYHTSTSPEYTNTGDLRLSNSPLVWTDRKSPPDSQLQANANRNQCLGEYYTGIPTVSMLPEPFVDLNQISDGESAQGQQSPVRIPRI